MKKRSSPFSWMDWLLLAAIAGLSILLLAMLLEPAVKAWKNRPRPGAQAPQQYLFERGSGDGAMTIPINYLLYLPPDYSNRDKWPLVVYLHGSGERGHDLKRVQLAGLPKLASENHDFPFLVLSPQCPKDSSWSPELVVALTDYISRSFSVDSDRVYLTGYSMGGYGAWATASQYPDRFAAIAPVCGGGDVEQAERLKNLPIWAFHGDKDTVVPPEASRTMVEAVRKCGGVVKYTEYPGAGHGIWDQTYQDKRLHKWLLDQRRNQHSK